MCTLHFECMAEDSALCPSFRSIFQNLTFRPRGNFLDTRLCHSDLLTNEQRCYTTGVPDLLKDGRQLIERGVWYINDTRQNILRNVRYSQT